VDQKARNSWWRRGLQFASGNMLLQALGFITGILIVRAVSIEEYALYAIYIGLVFALTSLSDSGVGSTLLAHGAKVHDNPERLAAWFRSGLLFRRRIGMWLTLFGIVCLVFLFTVNGASPWEAAAASAIMILTLEAVYRRGIWQVFFRLQLLANYAQNILILAALVRLGLVALTFVIPTSALLYLLVATALTYWLESWLLTRRGRVRLGECTDGSRAAKRAFRKAFKQMLPMNLVNVLRGQSVVFLLSVLGSTLVVSQVAALSRFSMVFAVLNAVVLELLSPRMARLGEERARILRAMATVLLIYLACSTAIILCMIPTATFILSLLGPDYYGLEHELIVISVGSVGINLAIAWGSLNHSRLWLAGSWYLVPLTVIWGVLGSLAIDLSSSAGAALFFATQALPLVLTELLRSMKGYWTLAAD
jgi:O-antigen/teichoic acid export membrane protein